jgi:radical SAM superfamily enzyme YgiQ (UPF0313 family)
MLKKNVYLIDLGTGTDRSLIPLGCGLIASYAKSIKGLNDYFNFEILMLEETLDGVVSEIKDPFAIGIACYVWNFLGAKTLAQMIKIKFPNSKIILGGPSIPQEPSRIKNLLDENSAVDILVHMEGEITFSELLKLLKDKKSLIECNGISFRGKESYITTPPRDRINDFTLIPSPYLTNVFDSVMLRYSHFIVGILWETNRGCPFACAFCDWGNAAVNKVTRLDIDRVVAEIKWASDRKIHYVYCTDANYGIKFSRDFEITEKIVEIIKQSGYPNTFVLNWTKNQHGKVIEIADKFREAGVATNTTISTQSFHPPVLKASLRDNIKLDEYMKLKRAYHDRGLSTYTELILGLPEETLETFLSGLDIAISPRLHDQVMVYLANILENTHLQKTIGDYGIETRRTSVGLNRRKFKFPRFGEDVIVVGTKTMPQEDWIKAYRISFLFLSLYNLRIAFFPLVLLNQYFYKNITSIVSFIINLIESDDKNYPVFTEVLAHIDNQIKKILSNESSVSETKNSQGVVFTPHEASTFIFATHINLTYEELIKILHSYCCSEKIDIDKNLIAESVDFQKRTIPSFIPGVDKISYRTNIAWVLYELSRGGLKNDIQYENLEVTIEHPTHNYSDIAEFNRRRVSSGYTISLANVNFELPESDKIINVESIRTPNARNVNMAGDFIKSDAVN